MRYLLLVVALSGCAWPTTPSPGTPGAAFPHPEGFGTGEHGPVAVADPAACAACHNASEPGGAGPSCTSCHAYPHDPGLHAGSTHAPLWQAASATCDGCHGVDGARAPAGQRSGQCTACHSTFPHGADWGGEHGVAVVHHGTAGTCTSCHDPVGDCASCHAAFPHAAGFAAPAAHGRAASATCTEGCHTETSASPTCASCHDLYPHPADWKRGHLVPVQARGEGACSGCHLPGTPAGPPLPVSCGASCHGGTP